MQCCQGKELQKLDHEIRLHFMGCPINTVCRSALAHCYSVAEYAAWYGLDTAASFLGLTLFLQ